VLLIAAATASARPADVAPGSVQVIVALDAPPAARALATGHARPALRAVERAQRLALRRINSVSPTAAVTWRYRIVLDGLAVTLPPGDVARVEALPGVAAVYPSVSYRALGGGGPATIGAPSIWGPGLENAGQGIKIGVIDDGIDPSHPYFDPAGYSMPAGFPRGDLALTTAKVIVARAFAPPGAGWRYAAVPFDPVHSSHGTHVAGIAAGNASTPVPAGAGEPRTEISGVAPRAYLGNYKVLTVPTASGVGLNGNSPEIVAAIEAAVADGMDVINLSLGEPEIDPARDAVAKALDNAAAAGVVPVVAAGNEFQELGIGSIGSPGTSARAITVAAASTQTAIASFSASGPTPLGLTAKPDVTAPGVDIISSVPDGEFEPLSGTSMASPHVAGAAALLVELHPEWSVEQIKSALVLTGRPVGNAPSARQGGGLVDLAEAAAPVLAASPQGVTFGLLDVSGGARTATQSVTLADAGGGTGIWSVRVAPQGTASGLDVAAPPAVTVPGELTVTASAAAGAAEGERTGFVLLERGGVTRRLPFWLRVTRPRLPDEPAEPLRGTATYEATTTGGLARVDAYRYPDGADALYGTLAGPERLFRLELDRPVANLGVAVTGAAAGVRVEPRIVRDADENRLTGATSLPYVANPYLVRFLEPVPSAAALLPSPGRYTIVFDTPNARASGRFRFRVWIDDVTPPRVRLVSRTARGGQLLARVSDAGAGVDPAGISYQIDGRATRTGRLSGRVAVLALPERLRPGPHRLLLSVSDRQEAKNNENVPRILPNTTVLRASFVVPAR
jgi:subtilisin family serine protease